MPAFIKTSPRKAARNRVKAANYRKVCAQVDARDGKTCRVCGVWAMPVHHHHIRFRSQGGTDTTNNLCVVCSRCHADIHDRKIRVTGDANATLQIERAA